MRYIYKSWDICKINIKWKNFLNKKIRGILIFIYLTEKLQLPVLLICVRLQVKHDKFIVIT